MHQPLKQEHQHAPEPIFSPGKEEQRPHFPSKIFRASASPVEGILNQAKEMVAYIYACIQDSQPDQALVNQSKALEWANQYVDGDIFHIEYIKRVLQSLHHTLCNKEFTCSPTDLPPNCVYVGQDFAGLASSQQLTQLIQQALAATPLPTRVGLPTSGYEHRSDLETWSGFVFGLWELLPEKPYLITGTPTNPLEKEAEAPEEDPETPVGPFRNVADRSGPLPAIRQRGFLRKIFGRR